MNPRFLLICLLLSSQAIELMAEVEMPLRRESRREARRARRANEEKIQHRLGEILVTEETLERVEEPLRREEAAKPPRREEKKELLLEKLWDRWRGLLRVRLRAPEKKQATQPKELGRLRPRPREPMVGRLSRSGPRAQRVVKQEGVQILSLAVPANVGQPAPQEGGAMWRDEHPAAEDQTKLRVGVWDRLRGRWRGALIRVGVQGETGKMEHTVRWSRRGEIFSLPRYAVVRLQVWAGEGFAPQEGWVALTQDHQEVVVEVASNLSAKVGSHPILMRAEAWEPSGSSMDWQKLQVISGLKALGFAAPLNLLAPGGRARVLEREDLLAWCMASGEGQLRLPVVNFRAAPSGPALRHWGVDGAPVAPGEGMEAWLRQAHRMAGWGGCTLFEGLSRAIEWNGQRVHPISWLMLDGGLVHGVEMRDEGDWGLYLEFLERGQRLSHLRPRPMGSSLPMADHRVLGSYRGRTELLADLKSGRTVAGRGVLADLVLRERLGGPALGRPGDEIDGAATKLFPKLSFQVDGHAGGVMGVELWVGSSLRQKSALRVPLMRGEALFAAENLEPGDAVLVRLKMKNGERASTAPIYVGKPQWGPNLHPVHWSLPEGWNRGVLVLKGPGLFREVQLKEGQPLELAVPLTTRYEFWGEELMEGRVMDDLFSVWSKSNDPGADAVEQWLELQATFPLNISGASQ